MTTIRESLASRDNTALQARLGVEPINASNSPYEAAERETGGLLYALRVALTSHSISASEIFPNAHFCADLARVNTDLREVLRFLKSAQ